MNAESNKSDNLQRQIAELKLLMKAATPGPWKSWVEGRDGIVGDSFIETAEQDIFFSGGTKMNEHVFDHRGGIRVADQDFIVTARNLLPDLIAEFERLSKGEGNLTEMRVRERRDDSR